MPSELVDIDIKAVAGVDRPANMRKFLIIKRAAPEVSPTDDMAKAVWTTAYMNDLPDSAFAYVEPGKKDAEGKTEPRSLRHLPYKDKEGKIDVAHVRDALSRLPQTDIPAAAKSRARSKLAAAARKVGVKASEEKAVKKGFLAAMSRLFKTNGNIPQPWMMGEYGPVSFEQVYAEWEEQEELDGWSNMLTALRQAILSIIRCGMAEADENAAIKASLEQFMECAMMAAEVEDDDDAPSDSPESVNKAGRQISAKNKERLKAAMDHLQLMMDDNPTEETDEHEGASKGNSTKLDRKGSGPVNKTLAEVLKAIGIDVDKPVPEEVPVAKADPVPLRLAAMAPETPVISDEVKKRLDAMEALFKAEQEKTAELAKRNAALEEQAALTAFAKRAEVEFSHLPGKADEKGRVLKALVEKMGGEEAAKPVFDLLKASEAAMRYVMSVQGRAGAAPANAEVLMESRVDDIFGSVVKSGVKKTREQVYAEFLETPEGRELYRKIRVELEGGAN